MKQSARRKFLKQMATVSAVGALPVLSGCASSEKSNDLSGMFVHHVFFWLKEADNAQVKADFRKALEELAAIETIRYKHIGTPAGTNREIIDTTYTFSLLVIFDNPDDHEVYQVHPIHDEFREKYADWWNRVQIYDSV
ncbi:MAG: Dabb family protein [Petrimonas sp.]|nr:Dabb family protein [Petrimonas sp.]